MKMLQLLGKEQKEKEIIKLILGLNEKIKGRWTKEYNENRDLQVKQVVYRAGKGKLNKIKISLWLICHIVEANN